MIKKNNQKYLGTIYRVINMINGLSYIGKTTTNIEKYINGCLRDAENGDSTRYFYIAVKKYKKENFKWEILFQKECTDEYLSNKEIFYIDLYNTFNNGYNLTLGGDGSLGYKHTDETKKGWKNRISPFFGKHHSKHSNEKNRIKHIGKIPSKETRKKISLKHSGEKHFLAKLYKFVSPFPYNKEFLIKGGFNKFCSDNNLSWQRMYKNIDQGIIYPWKFIKTTTKNAKNCIGWEVILLK